jgi:hypothetical protein
MLKVGDPSFPGPHSNILDNRQVRMLPICERMLTGHEFPRKIARFRQLVFAV